MSWLTHNYLFINLLFWNYLKFFWVKNENLKIEEILKFLFLTWNFPFKISYPFIHYVYILWIIVKISVLSNDPLLFSNPLHFSDPLFFSTQSLFSDPLTFNDLLPFSDPLPYSNSLPIFGYIFARLNIGTFYSNVHFIFNHNFRQNDVNLSLFHSESLTYRKISKERIKHQKTLQRYLSHYTKAITKNFLPQSHTCIYAARVLILSVKNNRRKVLLKRICKNSSPRANRL